MILTRLCSLSCKGRLLESKWTRQQLSRDHSCSFASSLLASTNLSSLAFFLQSKTSARIYPTYHTAFDTFDYVDKFVDPGEVGVGGVTRLELKQEDGLKVE